MLWHPTKLEIQDWGDFKELEFAQEEIERSWWYPIDWLVRYIYPDIYDSFFSEFHVILSDLLSKLETQQNNFQGGEPKEWTPFLIEWLKRISNVVSRVGDFWVDSIIEEYITEFVVDTIT